MRRFLRASIAAAGDALANSIAWQSRQKGGTACFQVHKQQSGLPAQTTKRTVHEDWKFPAFVHGPSRPVYIRPFPPTLSNFFSLFFFILTLTRPREIMNTLWHAGVPALHIAEQPFVDCPSGPSGSQFLMATTLFFTIIIALCGAIEKKFSTPTCPAFAMPCFWWRLCARCDRDARMLAQSVRDRPLAALLNLAAILFYEASLHHFTPGWIAHRENGN